MKAISKNKGFTLLEVLVAVSILSFITASVWSSLYSSAAAREAIEKRDNFHQRVRLVLDRLTNDLSLAFIVPPARGFTGFVGTESKLTFTTLAHQQIDPKSQECEESIVTYLLERNEARPTLYDLIRIEEKRLRNDFSEAKGRALSLLPGISELKFEYYDGEKFSDTWDNESIETKKKDNIPRAVKISLKVKDEDNFEHSLYTMVNVQLSRISPKTFQPVSVSSGDSSPGDSKGGSGSKGSDPESGSGSKEGEKTPTPSPTKEE